MPLRLSRRDQGCPCRDRSSDRKLLGTHERGTKVVPRFCFNTKFAMGPKTSEITTMTGPAKNRLHDYEAGWLTLLLKMGVANEKALQEAQNRVAQAAIDEMIDRRVRRRAEGRKRRRRD